MKKVKEIIMSLFKKKTYPPLFCNATVILQLMEELVRIDASALELSFESNGEKHVVGISSDYTNKRGFYDLLFYLDNQEFTSLKDFTDGATLDGVRFRDLGEITVLEDRDNGNPRNYTLLASNEIHK